jgi:peptidoglycan/LPS O-acetylase OafA/YrhL
MFVVFAFFAIFVKSGNPLWAVPLLFVVTLVVAAGAGEIVARYYSEPINRTLREYWLGGRRLRSSVTDAGRNSAEA